MLYIKTHEGFLQNLKDYWNADTTKKFPDKSELEDFCTDSLIDIEDNGLVVGYKHSKSGIKFDHSGKYTEDKDVYFEINVMKKNKDSFNTDDVKNEILFVVDLLKTEYAYDSLIITYTTYKERPTNEFDDVNDFDYMNMMAGYLVGDPKKISLESFEKLSNIKINEFSIKFNNITKK